MKEARRVIRNEDDVGGGRERPQRRWGASAARELNRDTVMIVSHECNLKVMRRHESQLAAVGRSYVVASFILRREQRG